MLALGAWVHISDLHPRSHGETIVHQAAQNPGDRRAHLALTDSRDKLVDYYRVANLLDRFDGPVARRSQYALRTPAADFAGRSAVRLRRAIP